MKKLLWAAVILLLFGLCSCSVAKKPAPPENKTFIVPEVSRVSFDTVDLKTAPKAVRDIAKLLENLDSTSWVQVGNKAYFIVSSGERSRGYDIAFDEILQRLPEENLTWIDVKLKYKKRAQPKNAGEPSFAVVRADIAIVPGGVGFTSTGADTAGPAVNTPPVKTVPAPLPSTQAQPSAVLEEPVANQEITSPLKIKGTVKSSGQKRVRLSTRGGQIIKEEELSTGKGGSITTSLNYSSPEMATPGELAIIEISGKEEKILTRVPVVIK